MLDFIPELLDNVESSEYIKYSKKPIAPEMAASSSIPYLVALGSKNMLV